MRPRHTDTTPGWINRRFAKLEARVKELGAAKRLQAATVGRGGVTIADQGGLTLKGGQMYVLDDGRVIVWGDNTYVQLTDGSVSVGSLNGLGDFVRPAMILQPDGFLAAYTDTKYAVFRVDEATGFAVVTSNSNGVLLPYSTTSDPANVRMELNGQVKMVTSSARFKRDVVDADVDVAMVLQLQPRRFRRKDDVAELGDDAPVYVGFIAEEAAALGLDDWVSVDDTGPFAFEYGSWVVALQAVARSHAAQVKTLTDRVTALEQRADKSEKSLSAVLKKLLLPGL